VLTARPATLVFAADAAPGSTRSATVTVLTDVKSGLGSAPQLTLYTRAALPPDLSASAALRDGSTTTLTATRETREATVTVTFSGTQPIGKVAAGRHTVTMGAYVCVGDFEDPNGPDGDCAGQEIDIAVIVEGAAIPTQPVGLAANVQPRQVFLSWNADPAPDRYRIERAPAGGAFATIATRDAPLTAYTDMGLDPNTAYTYRLTPINAAGEGPAATLDILTLADATAANGTLAVTVSGSGGGRVSSDPAGIDCPTDCSESLPLGRSVTLLATPASGSLFERWGGDADCADGVITVVAELACVAVFSPAPSGSRGWQVVGAAALTSGGQAPVIAADPLGGLFIAVRRPIGSFGELIVQRFDGIGWPALGGAAVNSAVGLGATSHALAIDRDGRPVVAWSEFSAVKVARWEDGRWNLIAEDLRVATDALPSQVQLAVRDLALVVSWVESSAGTLQLRAKNYNGALWFGGAGLEVPGFTGYRMTLDANGLPAVVVSRAVVGTQQPLRAFRATAFQNASVSWQALADDIPVATGNAFQHEQLGFGIGFTSAGAGAPVVLGTRDTRYAYVKNLNSVAWVPAGQFGVDADGVLADIAPASGQTLRGVLALSAQSVAAVLHIAPNNTLAPHRVELRSLDGLSWISWTDPLEVSRLSAVTSIALDASGSPLLTTLEGFGVGGQGLVRAYRWVP
jgi:Divergent InlB B-repeat domain